MMPRNRCTSDSHKQQSHDHESFDDITSQFPGFCLPDLKHLLRKSAYDAWNGKEKKEKDAIFYQTLSFNLSCTSFHECETEDIQQYISQIQKEKSFVKSPNSNEKQTIQTDTNKYLEREIASACRFKFPKEWTVIQLGKNFNANALFSRFEDIMTYNDGLSMTIFKHSAIQDMVMVDIKKPAALDNVFEKIFKLNKMITDNAQQCFVSANGQQLSDKEVREKYLKATQEIDVYVQDIVNNLTSFLGPWICALTGNFKSRKSIETENEIRKKVMEFLSTRSYFTDYQQKLIHLVARRTDLLSHQQIFVAITYILEEKAFGYDDIDLNDLYDHLTWIKQEFKYDDTSTHPCILIVDELLDQLPFEMVNLQQDFTRICSFANLKRLHEAHHGSFDINGHILISPNNCNALVNPENNLTSMEKRMQVFFNHWLPSWNVMYGKGPKLSSESLSQSDIFVFCGHGSGIHNVCDDVYNIKSRSVVFLFGCASAGLTTQGLHSELVGAHTYYHLGHSPSVIGFLWTVSDFPTDLCSTRILSGWVPSNARPHWQLIDKMQWRKSLVLNFTRVCDVITSPNLPEIITRMRSDMELPIALRASLVYRGIPVSMAHKGPKQ